MLVAKPALIGLERTLALARRHRRVVASSCFEAGAGLAHVASIGAALADDAHGLGTYAATRARRGPVRFCCGRCSTTAARPGMLGRARGRCGRLRIGCLSDGTMTLTLGVGFRETYPSFRSLLGDSFAWRTTRVPRHPTGATGAWSRSHWRAGQKSPVM